MLPKNGTLDFEVGCGPGQNFVFGLTGLHAVIERTLQQSFAFVFLDVNMPGIDGFSTARQLAADPLTKGIPVVFVTSKDQKADRAFAQMLGAKGYITKPYSAADIVSKL